MDGATSTRPILTGQAPSSFVQDSPNVELASNRTSLAFEQTRMSVDCTLMAAVRTSLSMITFGFVINEIYKEARDKPGFLLPGAPIATYFALCLAMVGVGFLALSLIAHRRFMRRLAVRTRRLQRLGMIRRMKDYQLTSTFVVGSLLLLLGLVVAASIVWRSVV